MRVPIWSLLRKMKTWYKAVCDEHKEMLDIFVDSVECTHAYLLDKDETIYTWLQLHYGCKLRLIHHDLDMDECFNKGYRSIR
jgi:hypothetical protein